MTTRLCWERYFRPDNTSLVCHCLAGHNGPHSWSDAQAEDSRCGITEEAQRLLDAITFGQFDGVLEAILAAAHGRKRALRNVPEPYGRSQR